MLRADGVGFRYASSDEDAVSDVTLGVAPGERVCVLGLNGSGKSTLARLLCGDMAPARGEISLDGTPLEAPVPGVGYVGQDPRSQFVSSTVWDEAAFGACNLGLPAAEVRERVGAALARCGLEGLAWRGIDELSGGQQQRLALAGALVMRPRHLVLDEVAAQLDGAATDALRALVSGLVSAGMGVVEVTHAFADLIGATRVAVMSAGRVAWRGTPEDLVADEGALRLAGLGDDPLVALARLLLSRGYVLTERFDVRDVARYVRLLGLEGEVGRMLDAYDGLGRRSRAGACARSDGASRAEGLRLEGVSVRYGDVAAVSDASLQVAPGEICLLLGETGSGKTTLCRVAAGLLAPDAGRALVHGAPVEAGQVGYAYQRSEDQLFADTVRDDIAFAPRNRGLAEDVVAERVSRACGLMGIGGGLLGSSPFSLSGGQRRRVALAGVIAQDAAAYVLDEPTAGLDGPSREALHALARSLADEGRAVLVVTHDVDEWLPWADHVALMAKGRLVGSWPAATACRRSDIYEDAGMRAPTAVMLRASLEREEAADA